MKETIQKHGKYKYTYYQNTHTIVKTPTQLSKHLHNCQNTYTIVKTPTQLSKHLNIRSPTHYKTS